MALERDGWIYVVLDGGRAGSGLVTLLVADLDAFLAEPAARGIASGPIATIGTRVRTAWVADPDGDRIQVGQPLAQAT